jgi:hypothetical protein
MDTEGLRPTASVTFARVDVHAGEQGWDAWALGRMRGDGIIHRIHPFAHGVNKHGY